ncbi:MAG: hypothetical protein J6Y05_04760 [Bacteroidales bacterium]|nr:hypothetical protein [Bacteroidales bacterium]
MEVSEKLPIFAPSEHPFWLSGQNPEKAGLYDTALGARHHDPYSTFKPSHKGWFYFSYNFLKVRKKLGLVAILRLTDICLRPLKTRTSMAFRFTSKYLCIAYSIKEYRSSKNYDELGNWQHEKIELLPLNKEYNPIVINEEEAEDFRVIGEFVGVID